MATLSQADQANLQAELNDLKSSIFVGVLVGAGSLILHFSNGSSILVQCPFETVDDGPSARGHGESPTTSAILFGFLNSRVADVTVDAAGLAELRFGQGRGIKIIPDDSGFESYVVRTSHGVSPVF
jgi:hypothetical protein